MNDAELELKINILKNELNDLIKEKDYILLDTKIQKISEDLDNLIYKYYEE